MRGIYTSLLLERPSYFVLNFLPRDTEPCVLKLNVDDFDGKINSSDKTFFKNQSLSDVPS